MSVPSWLRSFVGPLESLAIPYAIGGGIASTVYGEPRLTQDVDVLVDLQREDVGRLAQAFPEDRFYLPPPEVIAIERARDAGGHLNVIDLVQGAKADLYLAGTDPLNRLALDRRVRRSLGDLPVWLVPPEVVIVRKLEWHRDGASARQLRDVRAILAGPERLDRDLLERLVDDRDLGRWWREAIARGT